MKHFFIKIGILPIFSLINTVLAQHSTFQLESLSDFNKPAANWSIVSDVDLNTGNPTQFITQKGTGVLVNIPTEKANADLLTIIEHGDMDLELEFMMAKNSNSGIYLMGNYEIQLLDSWGKSVVTYADCGGVYEQWDDTKPEGEKGFMGYAPRTNACKAPGLWQKISISFNAPRFENGKKVKNAFINYVYLNGVLIHENVELTGPTRGNLTPEKATGPLRFQGDHGVVAFRNIKYKTYKNEKIYWSSPIAYDYIEQGFNGRYFNYWAFKPAKTGTLQALDYTVADLKDKFALRFTGSLNVSETNDYTFQMALNGNYVLVVNSDTVIKNGYAQMLDQSEFGSFNTIKLNKGDNKITLFYFKNAFWMPPSLGVFVSSSTVKAQPLHDFASFQPEPKKALLPHQPNGKLLVSRFFINDSKGKKITHPASVAFPTGLNFTVDTETMGMVQAWKGEFLEMSNAWIGRGGESVTPLGGPLQFFERIPSVAVLKNPNDAWPANNDVIKKLRYQSYYLNENKKIHFNYMLDSKIVFEDMFEHDVNENSLRRTLKVKNAGQEKTYVILAKNEKITDLKNGKYIIGEKEYLISVNKSMPAPTIRKTPNGMELIAPFKTDKNTTEYTYSLIW